MIFSINGQTVNVPGGNNVVVRNGVVTVDGKRVDLPQVGHTLVIEGDASVINCDGNVTINGNVGGSVDAGGSVSCGDVGGKVDAGGNVTCGKVTGSVDAGGSVRCSR